MSIDPLEEALAAVACGETFNIERGGVVVAVLVHPAELQRMRDTIEGQRVAIAVRPLPPPRRGRRRWFGRSRP